MSLDLVKLARIIGMSGSSHDGEALNAVRMAGRMINDAGMTWTDLLGSSQELEVATAACRALMAENEELRTENERLRQSSSATALAGWEDVDHRGTALWALRQGQLGKVWLSDFEKDFLGTAARWRGKLTERQKPVFDRIIDKVREMTGPAPP